MFEPVIFVLVIVLGICFLTSLFSMVYIFLSWQRATCDFIIKTYEKERSNSVAEFTDEEWEEYCQMAKDGGATVE